MGEARTKTMRGNKIKKPNRDVFSEEEQGEAKRGFLADSRCQSHTQNTPWTASFLPQPSCSRKNRAGGGARSSVT